MVTLQIHDLHASKHLDEKALAAISGGISFNWIRAYQPKRPSIPHNIFIGKIQVFNVLLVNPEFNILNQVAVINIDASNNTGSATDILVDLSQTGTNRS